MAQQLIPVRSLVWSALAFVFRIRGFFPHPGIGGIFHHGGHVIHALITELFQRRFDCYNNLYESALSLPGALRLGRLTGSTGPHHADDEHFHFRLALARARVNLSLIEQFGKLFVVISSRQDRRLAVFRCHVCCNSPQHRFKTRIWGGGVGGERRIYKGRVYEAEK